MANKISYKDKSLGIGDAISVDYRIIEGEGKERIQQFAGIVLKIRGNTDATRMITVRKISKSGVGVERIFPLASPFVSDISVVKPAVYQRAKAYFIRDLSGKKLRQRLYKGT